MATRTTESTTSIKVAVSTRDGLNELATAHGLTVDRLLRRMIRRGRAERLADQLAARGLSDDDRLVMNATAATVARLYEGR